MPAYRPKLSATNVRFIFTHLVAYNSQIPKIKGQKNFDLNRCPLTIVEEIVSRLGTPVIDKDNNTSKQQEEKEHQPTLDNLLRGPADVIAGHYEGGFKIWECSIDLIEHFNSTKLLSNQSFPTSRSFNVLDVGCGSGHISLFLAQHLATHHPNLDVKFYLQDYNLQVLQTYTVSNVLLNQLQADEVETLDDVHLEELINSRRLSSFNYLYGDWDVVREELTISGLTFDLIVTAETIYNESNYGKLAQLFHQCLSKPNGLVYIAAKSHYFGCGGGTYSFLDYLLLGDGKQHKQDDTYQLYMKEQIEIDGPLVRNIACLGWKEC